MTAILLAHHVSRTWRPGDWSITPAAPPLGSVEQPQRPFGKRLRYTSDLTSDSSALLCTATSHSAPCLHHGTLPLHQRNQCRQLAAAGMNPCATVEAMSAPNSSASTLYPVQRRNRPRETILLKRTMCTAAHTRNKQRTMKRNISRYTGNHHNRSPSPGKRPSSSKTELPRHRPARLRYITIVACILPPQDSFQDCTH